MEKHRNIVLVGFMGTGKTCVGKLIAWRNSMTFVDMDDVIQQRSGKTISRIFADDGEAHFRALERELVKELASNAGHVIATGGGVVLNAENISDFTRTGLVVCLQASPQAVLKRTEGDSGRPLLAGGDKMKKISALLELRKPLYDAIPHRIDTTGLAVEEVADKVMSLYAAV